MPVFLRDVHLVLLICKSSLYIGNVNPLLSLLQVLSLSGAPAPAPAQVPVAPQQWHRSAMMSLVSYRWKQEFQVWSYLVTTPTCQVSEPSIAPHQYSGRSSLTRQQVGPLCSLLTLTFSDFVVACSDSNHYCYPFLCLYPVPMVIFWAVTEVFPEPWLGVAQPQ